MRLETKQQQPEDKTLQNLQKAVKDAVEPVMTAFEEFKSSNDLRISEIEKRGNADPILTEKIGKIETSLVAFEGVNQKLTLLEAQKKAIDDVNARFDAIEAAVKRVSKDQTERKTSRVDPWARAVINAHLVGIPNLSEDQRKVLDAVRDEYKALALTPDTAGGYLAPVEYVREIIKSITLISPVRLLARVRQTALKAVEQPKRTGQFPAQWVSEQGTRSETTGLTYGLETINTFELYALIDISNQMLEDSAFSMETEINTESSDQFAVAEGAAFVSGNGVGKPEGFLSSSAGVSTTNSGTATTIADANGQADGLITLKHAIKSGYGPNKWVMNRTTLGSVRKLKDGNKQYIWMPGLANGMPNTIDGDPYVELPDMPNEGAGNYPIAYGDWVRAYTWVDRIAMEMLRDPYTQATAGNVRFIMRKRVGGRVVLPEAIRILKCST